MTSSTKELNLTLADKGILFREKEVSLLSQYFGPPSSVPFPSFFIYGHPSTGKTYIISELLAELKLPHVWINCQEIATLPTLLSMITDQIADIYSTTCETNCNNVCDLVNILKEMMGNTSETTYIVFDNAEILRNKFPTVLPALWRLQEITELNITSIFISDVVWEKFRNYSGLFDPIEVHFSDYTKEQLISILCLDCPAGYSKSFYEGYADIIMKVFFVVTRDLNELRHVAQLNFTKYVEPVLSGEATESNTLKLFRNIEPTLKEAIHAVFLREVSGHKWTSQLQVPNPSTDNDQSTAVSKFHLTKELPFYSKFLLLAAYFASYNLPKSDIKHFVKNQGKQKKKHVGRKTEKNRHLLGPKAFTLDRMLSIFFSIVGHNVLPSALILSQVSSLCSLQLISRISMEQQLDTPKYKCLAELDLVRNIGKTVGIDVMGYLDDFI